MSPVFEKEKKKEQSIIQQIFKQWVQILVVGVLDLFRTRSMTPGSSGYLLLQQFFYLLLFTCFFTSSLQTRSCLSISAWSRTRFPQHKHVTGGSRSPQLYSQLYWDRVHRQRDKNRLPRRLRRPIQAKALALTRQSISSHISTKSLAFYYFTLCCLSMEKLSPEPQPTATSSPLFLVSTNFLRAVMSCDPWARRTRLNENLATTTPDHEDRRIS